MNDTAGMSFHQNLSYLCLYKRDFMIWKLQKWNSTLQEKIITEGGKCSLLQNGKFTCDREDLCYVFVDEHFLILVCEAW